MDNPCTIANCEGAGSVEWFCGGSWSESVSVEFTTFDAQKDKRRCVDWFVIAMYVGVECGDWVCRPSPIGRVVVKPGAGATLAKDVGGCWSAHIRMECLPSVCSISRTVPCVR